MKRDPQQLANESFDVLVVGAGIYGATIAARAAAQGIKVALIDKGDFGHSTSANSQKIIHGGLRYLQHLDLGRMRQSIGARRQLMTFAPHLVRPLQCIVPTYGYGLRSRPVMAAALTLNDIVSWDRNSGLDDDLALPNGRTVSAAECRRMIPGLSWNDITGGAVWFDATATNTERLTLMYVSSAVTDGACAANYVRATRYLESDNTIRGVVAEDALNGETFDIRAALVVNAMGPWTDRFLKQHTKHARDIPQKWCRAMNIVVNRRLFGESAVGLTAGRYVDRDALLNKGTRDFFFVPWRQTTIIGTFYDRFPGRYDQSLISAEDIHRMLNEINSAYPPAELRPKDVGFAHAGLLPEASTSGKSQDIQLLKHPAIVDAEQTSGLRGLLSVVGVKYTTAAQVAPRVVRASCDKLGRESVPAAAAESRRPVLNSPTTAGPSADGTTAAIELSITDERLNQCYGSALSDVLRFLDTADSRHALSPDQSVTVGEVVYGVRQEMAQKLSDIVFRRTGLGTDRYPGRPVLLRCAEVMAAELEWTSQRMLNEINEVERIYSPLFEAGCTPCPEPFQGSPGGTCHRHRVLTWGEFQ